VNEVALAFHDLSYVSEGNEVVVGRVDSGSYAVLPLDGAELLRRMSEGMSPELAAEWYQRTYDEPVDIDEFVATLDELGFLRSDTAPPAQARKLRYRGLATALFSPIAGLAYLALLIGWLVLCWSHRDIRPASSQIFFTSSLLVIQIVITFGQIPLLFLHEGAHILAGQRLGLSSRLNVSSRLTYVVFETQLNGLLSVARRRRYLPFLAGILTDLLVLGAFGVIAQLSRHTDGSLSLTGRLCLALAFTVVMRIAWQFQLYLRTDLYYVFATALNCFDLHDASKSLLKNRIWRTLGQPQRLVDEEQWTGHERRVANWYGPFLVLGVGSTIAIMVFGSAPIIGQYFGTIWRNLSAGEFDNRFFDSAFSLSFNLAQLIALFFLSRRKRRQAAVRAPRLLAS
jgi:hypothetical protein